MTIKRTSALGGLALVGVLGLAGCGSDDNSSAAGPSTSASDSAAAGGSSSGCPTGSLSAAGSTFQQNIQMQWATDYASQCSGAKVSYTGTGSGAGIQQFGAGTIALAGSDVPMASDESAAAKKACGSAPLTVPVTAGGVAIIYNLPVKNVSLDAATLAKIFTGKITKWDDPAIKASNPGVSLPSTRISPYHRADDSGTTAVFSAFLQADAGSAWKLGSDKTLQWPSGSGQAATGSSGTVAGVKQTTGGITYAEVSYATANSLPTAKVKGASGGYIAPTSANVSKAIASGFTAKGSGADQSGTLSYTKMSGYPISTVSYAIACTKYSKAATGALVKGYLTYALGGGQMSAEKLGFAPLPSAVAAASKSAVSAIS